MPEPSNLAGFGTTPINKIVPPSLKGQEGEGRYKALFDAIYHIVYPTDKQQIDQQTRLEWENIVGEVMMEVLKADLLSGVPLLEITHPFFRFAAKQECIDRFLTDKFVEKLKEKHLLPSMTILKRKINEQIGRAHV